MNTARTLALLALSLGMSAVSRGQTMSTNAPCDSNPIHVVAVGYDSADRRAGGARAAHRWNGA